MKHCINAVICFLVVSQVVAHKYVYEFGQDTGSIIYQYEGHIPILKHITEQNIPVPNGITVTYVKVTVNSISPPKVDYLSDTKRVSIAYGLTQLCLSNYSIVVKGKRV